MGWNVYYAKYAHAMLLHWIWMEKMPQLMPALTRERAFELLKMWRADPNDSTPAVRLMVRRVNRFWMRYVSLN